MKQKVDSANEVIKQSFELTSQPIKIMIRDCTMKYAVFAVGGPVEKRTEGDCTEMAPLSVSIMPTDAWACTFCLKLNDHSVDKCTACQTQKNTTNGTPASRNDNLEGISTGASEICDTTSPITMLQDSSVMATASYWRCSQCTFMNPPPLNRFVIFRCYSNTTYIILYKLFMFYDKNRCEICDTDRPPAVLFPEGVGAGCEVVKEVDITATTSCEPFLTQVQPEDVIAFAVTNIKWKEGSNEYLLERSILEKRWTPVELLQRMSLNWNLNSDTILIEFINQFADKSQKSVLHLVDLVPSMVLPKKSMQYLSEMNSEISTLEVQARILLILYLNELIESILPHIDVFNSDPASIGKKFQRCSRYILSQVKQPILDKAIWESKAGMNAFGGYSRLPASLTLSNTKAMLSESEKRIEPTTSTCCFVQAFHALHSLNADVFRYVFNGDCVFKVHFEEERGIDEGGVFREGITRIVEDLFSENINLLLLCPNGVHSVHINMDKYVPNPKYMSGIYLEMYEFVGKLMGMSLRAKLYLPFEFPPFVWKKLVGDEVDIEDLMDIDTISCRFIRDLMGCEDDGIVDQEFFSRKYGDRLTFTYNGSDGIQRDLVNGGTKVIVNFNNRNDYCEKVIAARLSEFDEQATSIAKGFKEVVPTDVIKLYSWSQFETLVCGTPTLDVDLWKRNTIYSGLKQETCDLFWEVMRSFTPKEQSGFVRFAWGRSRLPNTKSFPTKMELMKAGSYAILPVAHTCFFSVELPEYNTEEKMRHGLLTAINYGGAGILLA